MKKWIYVWICCLLTGAFSCDTNHLRDMDIPKYMVTDDNAELGMLFSNIQVEYTRRSALHALRIPAGYAKYYATHSMIMPGDRYQYDQANAEDPWNMYTNEAKMVVHLMRVLEERGEPEQINNLSVLKILKGAMFSWITDIYGDVPYSDVGLAYLEGLLYSAYDTQEFIYKDILSMLDDACTSFDNTQGVWGNMM